MGSIYIATEEVIQKLKDACSEPWSLIKWPASVMGRIGYSLDMPFTIAVVLNDRFEWSREAIADYLEKEGA